MFSSLRQTPCSFVNGGVKKWPQSPFDHSNIFLLCLDVKTKEAAILQIGHSSLSAGLFDLGVISATVIVSAIM